MLGASGVLHLGRPQTYARIVPAALGDPGPWVAGSGIAELVCAAGLVVPGTRALAARATALLFLAVFPANVQMAVSALRPPASPPWYVALSLVRLPLQAPLVGWARAVAARAAAPETGAR